MGVHQRGLGLAYANEILGNVGSGVWKATIVYYYGIPNGIQSWYTSIKHKWGYIIGGKD